MCGKYKNKLYDSYSGTGLQLYYQYSSGKRNGKFSQNGKFGRNGMFGQKGKFGQNGKVHLGLNVSSSTHNCGCVVNGSNAMAAM